MEDTTFEDLELHVLTLAFQIEGLKKNAMTNKQRDSLRTIEEDYRYYKKQYDQQVKKIKKAAPKEVSFGDWK